MQQINSAIDILNQDYSATNSGFSSLRPEFQGIAANIGIQFCLATIDPDGNVGDIGGIQQKLIGARDAGAVLFLAPVGNCDEVQGHIPDGLTVAAVATLEEAMSAIESFNSGKTVIACLK